MRLMSASANHALPRQDAPLARPDLRRRFRGPSRRCLQLVADSARFRRESLYKLPVSDYAFDAARCTEVIRHAHDFDRAFADSNHAGPASLADMREPGFTRPSSGPHCLRFDAYSWHVNFRRGKAFPAVVRGQFRILAMERKCIKWQPSLMQLRDQL